MRRAAHEISRESLVAGRAREAPDFHSPGAGREQPAGALPRRRAGGGHVVHEEDAAGGAGARPEGPAHVLRPARERKTALALGRPHLLEPSRVAREAGARGSASQQAWHTARRRKRSTGRLRQARQRDGKKKRAAARARRISFSSAKRARRSYS